MADNNNMSWSFGELGKRFSFGRGRRRRASGGPTTRQGKPGFQHSHGYIGEHEDNPKLRRKHKYETFSEIIANHLVVSSGMRVFLSTLQKTKWTPIPIEGDAESARQAEAIESILDKMETAWPQIVRRSGMYVFYGFGLQEWTAKRLGDGTIGIADIEPRAQHTIERWDIDDRGQIVGVEQRNPNDGELLPIERRRLIYCVDDALNDSPEGLGLLRQIFTTTERLENYYELESVGFTNDLRGIPILRAPLEEMRRAVAAGSMTADDANKKVEVLRGFISNHERKDSSGMLLDSTTYQDRDGKPSTSFQYSVELLRGDGIAQTDLQTAITRSRNDVALGLASSFLLLGEDGAGSLALSKTKMDAFMLAVESTLEYLAFVYKRDLLRQIARLNGWDEDSLPSLGYEAPKMQDIIDLLAGIRDLSAASGGLDPEDPIIDWARNEMGAPVRPDDIIPEAGSLDPRDPDAGGPRRGSPNPFEDDPNNKENDEEE